MNCEFCGREEALPFVCNYCGGVFCAEHRLPEAHQCKGDLTQRRTVVAPPTTTFSWSDQGAYSPQPPQRTGSFSGIEIRDIVIAWLALAFAFSLALSGGGLELLGAGSGVNASGVALLFGVALVTVGPGFVLHELMHKFVAQRYGFWAEFRMWPLGLVLALVTSLIGFIFAAPGATYISGANISEKENGIISYAGPLTNIAVAAIFTPVLLYSVLYTNSAILQLIGVYGVYINVFLAMFNLLPIMPLDGAKVFRWSKTRWIATFVPLVLVFIYFLIDVF